MGKQKNSTTTSKTKIKDKSKEELVFTEKEKCKDCKDKEVKVSFPNYTREEMEQAMVLVNKFSLSREEVQWLTALNNRVNNDNKQVGCGKCFVQVKKNLTNAYQRLYG